MSEVHRGLEAENARLRQLLAQAGIDAAKSDIARQLQKLMLDEMHHRVKNTLAMVQAIASQSLKAAESLDDARSAIEARLAALGKVHDLLLRTNWGQARLSAILTTAVAPFGGAERFMIESAEVDVLAPAALPVAMVLNELCTNAVKYGSLSQPKGRVDLKATVDERARAIRLIWEEIGGPTVQPPARRSFGTQLIEHSLLGPLEGKVKLHFHPAGVVCEMEVPLAKLRPENSN